VEVKGTATFLAAIGCLTSFALAAIEARLLRDLIVVTGNTFKTLLTNQELKDFFAAVKRSLRPGGCFAFETRNPVAPAWETWNPENAAKVVAPGITPVEILTEVIDPYDGCTIPSSTSSTESIQPFNRYLYDHKDND
jgi:SAM-dependent methyltransferase